MTTVEIEVYAPALGAKQGRMFIPAGAGISPGDRVMAYVRNGAVVIGPDGPGVGMVAQASIDGRIVLRAPATLTRLGGVRTLVATTTPDGIAIDMGVAKPPGAQGEAKPPVKTHVKFEPWACRVRHYADAPSLVELSTSNEAVARAMSQPGMRADIRLVGGCLLVRFDLEGARVSPAGQRRIMIYLPTVVKRDLTIPHGTHILRADMISDTTLLIQT